MTTDQIHKGNEASFGNPTNEIFVGSIGELQADTITFYNVTSDVGYTAIASGPIKKMDLQQESCAHMSAFCGPAHFSICIASVTGSMQIWSPRPNKFVQPLSPNFTEIEDNILYVEKEDEFESEISSEDETDEEKLGNGAFGKSLIKGLTKQ